MATTVASNLWLPSLRPRLAGADDPFITLELNETLKEFARRTGAWIVEVEGDNVVSGTSTYTLSSGGLGSTNNALYVLAAFFKHVQLVPLASPPRYTEVNGTPKQFYNNEPGEIRLVPPPDTTESGVLDLTIACVPNNVTNVPADWYNIWHDGIMHGVLHRMYDMQRKPWSSQGRADKSGIIFSNCISEARDVMRRRYSTSQISWKFPPWA